LFKPNTWLFNTKIAQYGTKLILTKQNDSLIIETLAFINYQREFLITKTTSMFNIKCLTSNDDNEREQFDVYEAIRLETSIKVDHSERCLWRIRCRVPSDKHRFQFEQIKIALIDIFQVQEPSLVSFHEPTFYDAKEIIKKKAVAHCVHMMRDLENDRLKRLYNWIDMQKRLGIDKFRFYFFRVSKESEQGIRDKFGNDLIQIIDYKLDKDFLCGIYNQISDAYQNCLSLFKIFFDNSVDGVFNAHEKVFAQF
jgi:hypothetical protein